jgi:hypothetical protein
LKQGHDPHPQHQPDADESCRRRKKDNEGGRLLNEVPHQEKTKPGFISVFVHDSRPGHDLSDSLTAALQ